MAIAGPSDFYVNKVLNILRAVTYTGITSYVGFVTAGPSASDGTGLVELVHADYTRKACSFSAASLRAVANSGNISFVASSTSAWNSGNPLKRFGIWDDPAAGNLLWVDEILPVLTVGAAGIPVVIPTGILILRANTRTVTD